MRRFVPAGAALLALTLVGALLGRGSLAHFGVGGVVGAVFGLFGVACLIVAGFARRFSEPRAWHGRFRSVGVAALVVAAGAWASYAVGLVVSARDVRVGRAWCESRVPELDAWRARTGHYPDALTELGITDRDLPRVCRRDVYLSTGTRFSFEFADPSAVLAWWSFDSEDRVWRCDD
jgi:hypothetical protein